MQCVELGQSVCNACGPHSWPLPGYHQGDRWVGWILRRHYIERAVCFSAVFTCVCTRLHHYQPLAASSHNWPCEVIVFGPRVLPPEPDAAILAEVDVRHKQRPAVLGTLEMIRWTKEWMIKERLPVPQCRARWSWDQPRTSSGWTPAQLALERPWPRWRSREWAAGRQRWPPGWTRAPSSGSTSLLVGHGPTDFGPWPRHMHPPT